MGILGVTTRGGMSVRAVTQDASESAVVGIAIKRMFGVAIGPYN